MERLRHRAMVAAGWAALSFVLYVCFISSVDGPELIAAALISVAVGLVAALGVESAGGGVLGANSRWYVPLAAWPRDFVADCVLLARVVVARVSGRRGPTAETRTIQVRAGVSPAVAGFWLSSTPGTCVVGAEGRELKLHALRRAPSNVERALTAPADRSG